MNQGKPQLIHLTPRYSPSTGGIETHLAEVNKYLMKNFSVTVVTFQHQKELPLTEEIMGVTVVRIPYQYLASKLMIWRWIWQHQNIFKHKKLFIHDITWVVLPILPQLFKLFCIVFHGWEGIYPVPWKNIWQRRLFAACARTTLHIGAFIQQFYGDIPSAVSYGGAPELQSKNLIFNSPKPPYHFVFIGRLEAVNEVDKYIQFFKVLTNRNISYMVTWVGDGALRSKCEQIGPVTGMIADVKKYIVRSDFVCASSYLSILEAQAYGKVVLSLYSHPLKQAYLETYSGKAAMVVANSPEKLAAEVIKILKHPSVLIELGTAAAQFARQNTWQRVANLYETLANRL